MVTDPVGGHLIADNADDPAHDANIQPGAVQLVTLLNVVLQITPIFIQVLFGSSDIFRFHSILGQPFSIAGSLRIHHTSHTAASKSAPQRAGFLQVKAPDLQRMLQCPALLLQAVNHLQRASNAQHTVKDAALDHRIQMRSEYNGLGLRVSAREDAMQISNRILLRFHPQGLHPHFDLLQGLEIPL